MSSLESESTKPLIELVLLQNSIIGTKHFTESNYKQNINLTLTLTYTLRELDATDIALGLGDG